jgi:flagellar basal body rod protein FlgC
MNVLSVALDSIGRATTSLDTVAARVAHISSPESGPSDYVELSVEMIALMDATTAFEASMAVMRTANEMNKSLVDLIA